MISSHSGDLKPNLEQMSEVGKGTLLNSLILLVSFHVSILLSFFF